jgi:hypothetical protein
VLHQVGAAQAHTPREAAARGKQLLVTGLGQVAARPGRTPSRPRNLTEPLAAPVAPADSLVAACTRQPES